MPLPVPHLTIDMLDDFPEDGTRYELLEGMLLVTPAPTFAHQIVATRLATMLANALSGGAQVVAVGAIQRAKHTQLQPDVLVCRGVLDRGSRRMLSRNVVAGALGRSSGHGAARLATGGA